MTGAASLRALAGLWGGALPQVTSDGWALERTSDDRVLLRPPDGDAAEIHHETLFELRAVGFSPSGAALVIASAGELTLLTRQR